MIHEIDYVRAKERKQVLLKYIKYIEANVEPVPHHPSLELKHFYKETLNRRAQLIEYFPHYDDSYIPPRDFFWAVY
jgi:hypothetical protein